MPHGVLRPLFLMMVLLALGLHGERPSPWYFMPNFGIDVRGVERITAGSLPEELPPEVKKLLEPGSPWPEDRQTQILWYKAAFPHQDFVRMMPENNVFGWYAHAFRVPAALKGVDMLADLGIIDDADETFVNSHRVGGLGKVPDGSAWQKDRLYRISAGLLADGDNLLAVHVWSQWGLGGMVGPPVLKAALAPADAEWEVAFRPSGGQPPDGLNTLRRTAEAVDRCLGSGSVEWRKCAGTWGCEWPDGSHYAVFRLPVALRGADGLPLRLEKPVALDVGLVFDVAAVYLNEQRIGLVGRFPDGERVAFTEAAARGLAVVPPEAWSKDGNDCLTLVVYRERGVGGVSGAPGFLLHNPLEDIDLKDIASVNAAFSLLLHSGCFAEAGALLDKAAPADGAARAWLLSHKAHLSYLQWVDGGKKDEALLDGVLSPVAEILSSLPAEAPKQSAMQAFCRVLRLAEKNAATADAVRRRFPSFDGNCTVLSDDRMTLGDWQMHYGNRFYVLAAMGQVRDWNGPGGREPLEYSVTVPADRDIARYWLPASQRELDDPSALLMHGRYKKGLSEVSEWQTLEKLFPLSGGKFRRSSWWDDHGEMHPFDDGGPDLQIDLAIYEPVARLALYLEDHDWKGTAHPRQQSVVLFDEEGAFRNAAWLGKLDKGVYVRFMLKDMDKARLRVCKHRGACVAVSGLFVDCSSNLEAVSEKNARMQLGPERARLFKVLTEGEASMQTERQVAPFMKDLAAVDSLKEVRGIISLLSKADIHPCWMYMAVTRGFELCDGADSSQRVFFLQDVMGKCTPNVLYPLGDQAVLRWIRYGLFKNSPDVVNYRKRRREVVAEAVKWQKEQEAKKAQEEKRTEGNAGRD